MLHICKYILVIHVSIFINPFQVNKDQFSLTKCEDTLPVREKLEGEEEPVWSENNQTPQSQTY